MQLAGCSALRELHLDINHLTDVPPLPFLSRLTHLDLGQNMLTKLPSTLDRMVGLRHLKLSDMSAMVELRQYVAAVLSRLPSLKFVSSMHNGDMSPQVAALLSIQRARPDLKWVLERNMVAESGVGAGGDFGLLAEYLDLVWYG